MIRAATVLAFLVLAAPAQAGGQAAVDVLLGGADLHATSSSSRGFDGRTFNFPEESATYWLARFRLAEGQPLVLRGRYPHGRYMSLNAYAEGVPTDALSDVAHRAGRRARPTRSWPATGATASSAAGRVTVRQRAAAGRGPRVEHALRAAVAAMCRSSSPTASTSPTAGRDLTGRRRRCREAATSRCDAINDANRDITVQTIEPALWRAGTACRHRATRPSTRSAGSASSTSTTRPSPCCEDCTAAGFAARRMLEPAQQGGFYSNRDSAYIFAHLSRELGEIVVVRGKLPRFPRTRAGAARMGRGQLRFWSLCTGESRVTTRTPDCLADRQLALGRRRAYTVVVSKPRGPARPTRAAAAAYQLARHGRRATATSAPTTPR